MKIVMATNNRGKIEEYKKIFNSLCNGVDIELLTLEDVGIDEDIPETTPTAEGNAKMKVDYVRDLLNNKYPVMADDSVLVVNALSERFQHEIPGVYTGRYYEKMLELRKDQSDLKNIVSNKDNKDLRDDLNMDQLLMDLENFEDRSAIFKTVIAFKGDGIGFVAKGEVDLEIANEKRGTNGFGFDPILKYGDKTLAEMTYQEKEAVSHRTKAAIQFIEYLKKIL